MTWFRKPHPSRDPAIHHDELRDIVERLHDRLAMAEATIESQATEIATLRADGKKTNGALCQLANDAAPAVKTHERLDELRHDLRVLQSAVYELTGTVVRSKTICERFELTETAVEQLAANEKALGDRLTVQAGIIGSTELAVAETRDSVQRLKESSDRTINETQDHLVRIGNLETAIADRRSELNERLKVALRVLSGEATVATRDDGLVKQADSDSNVMKVVNRETGQTVGKIRIP